MPRFLHQVFVQDSGREIQRPNSCRKKIRYCCFVDQASVALASLMPLSRRKSMLEDLRKVFSSGKEPDVPPVPPMPPVLPVLPILPVPALPKKDPVDVPVSALRISRYGLVQDVQLA